MIYSYMHFSTMNYEIPRNDNISMYNNCHYKYFTNIFSDGKGFPIYLSHCTKRGHKYRVDVALLVHCFILLTTRISKFLFFFSFDSLNRSSFIILFTQNLGYCFVHNQIKSNAQKLWEVQVSQPLTNQFLVSASVTITVRTSFNCNQASCKCSKVFQIYLHQNLTFNDQRQ